MDYYGSWTEVKDERLGHGIHPDYYPQAFEYDAARNEWCVRRGSDEAAGWRCTSTRPGAMIAVVAPSGGSARRKTMPKHGRTVSVRIEPAALTRYHAKMETDAAKAIYKQRAPVAEFPNAWLKTKLKWVRLQSRGLIKAKAEALRTCLTHNLQRYFKLRQPQVA